MQMYSFLSLFLLNKSLKFVNIYFTILIFIKLDAIDSTNDYLKQLSKKNKLENFTTVIANEQTNGRGQMGSSWVSDAGKNITMSILVSDLKYSSSTIFDWNVIVSLAVAKALEEANVPNISIKWPNDIMADSKKVGGILIENSLKQDESFDSIIGIGINVNQENFNDLPKATSLKNKTNKTYNVTEISEKIALNIQAYYLLKDDMLPIFWQNYHQRLFRKGIPTTFEDQKGNRFMGIIQSITRDGKLQLILENDTVAKYSLKEIQMLF